MCAIDISSADRVITVTVDGVLTLKDALAVIGEHYARLNDGGCVWDLRRSDVFQLSPSDLEAIALNVAQVTVGDSAPKSAFVVADAKAYTRVCSYLTRDTRMRARIEAAVFTRLDDAYLWVRQT